MADESDAAAWAPPPASEPTRSEPAATPPYPSHPTDAGSPPADASLTPAGPTDAEFYPAGAEPPAPQPADAGSYPGPPEYGHYPYAGHDPYAAPYPYGGQYPSQPSYAGPPRRAGLGGGRLIAIVAVVALLAGLIGGATGFALARRTAPAAIVPLPQAPGDTSPRGATTIAGIAAAILPSVVSLRVNGSQVSGTGSGFVVRADGYLVTNNHVAAPAAAGGAIEVVFNDGSRAKATVVGRNVSYDLAVLKVDRSGLPVAALGNSDSVEVGDLAIAIGSPLGLSGTVTSGIVSALDRPVTAGGRQEASYISAIQTDAAINPGNSGGPLLDGAGQVIGVNSAIATLATEGASGQGGSIGLGFAIPVNQAKRIAEEIIATGRSTTPVVGVSLDLQYAGSGARIGDLTSGGPAAGAGLRVGDVVVAVNGRPVDDATSFIVAVRSSAPGDTVVLTVERDGDRRELKVQLGADTSGG
ncbi:MAG: PDZ domain-containing protein [Actinomycetota bacterium]|nr:MAG: PDZ domain-containing protein [Actinomycetota bacterium]